MTIVLDTNVLMSGIFFTGIPSRILRACQHEVFDLAVSVEIIAEYRRVAGELSKRYPKIDATQVLDFIISNARLIEGVSLPAPVCDDPDDDKFIACALACDATCIVSGDHHLLQVSGFQGIVVLNPRGFAEQYFASPDQ